MPLPEVGQELRLSQIHTEFNRATGYGLRAYVGNGSGIPASLPIRLSDFHGLSSQVVINITQSTRRFNVAQEAPSLHLARYDGDPGKEKGSVVINIQNGVTVSQLEFAEDPGNDYTDYLWADVTINNYGTINQIAPSGDGAGTYDFSSGPSPARVILNNVLANIHLINYGTLRFAGGGGGSASNAY